MMPYVNVENLLDHPSRLIGLLHYRSTYAPHDWVPFDNALLQPAWKRGALEEKSAPGCITMHGSDYGKWIDFDKPAVHLAGAYGSPRALLILETQQRLFAFLRKVTNILLEASKLPIVSVDEAHDSNTRNTNERMVCMNWMRFVKSRDFRDTQRLSFGRTYAQQPFSTPVRFDVNVLIDIAENQAAEAYDELWLLQTDLEYFHDRAIYFEARWFDTVPGLKKLHPMTDDEKYDNVAFILTILALTKAQDWQWIVDECYTLKREFDKSSPYIQAGKALPQEYGYALAPLKMLLMKLQVTLRNNLLRLMLRSPQL